MSIERVAAGGAVETKARDACPRASLDRGTTGGNRVTRPSDEPRSLRQVRELADDATGHSEERSGQLHRSHGIEAPAGENDNGEEAPRRPDVNGHPRIHERQEGVVTLVVLPALPTRRKIVGAA